MGGSGRGVKQVKLIACQVKLGQLHQVVSVSGRAFLRERQYALQ